MKLPRSWKPYAWIVGVLVFLYLVGEPLAYRLSATTTTCTVTEKDDKAKPGQETGSTYMVWCRHQDGEIETFEVTDTMIFFTWNSSDRWGRIERNREYELYVAGWRIPMLSTYRNIIESKPVE